MAVTPADIARRVAPRPVLVPAAVEFVAVEADDYPTVAEYDAREAARLRVEGWIWRPVSALILAVHRLGMRMLLADQRKTCECCPPPRKFLGLYIS